MIRFYYSPDGVYSEKEEFVEKDESIVFDAAHNKIRLFDTSDFYFQTLSDEVGEDASSSAVGLSQKGAYLMQQNINTSINTLDARIEAIEFDSHVSYEWSRVIQSVTYEENPEYARVYLDAEDKILYAVDIEGNVVIDADTTNMETNSDFANGLYLERLVDFLEFNELPQLKLLQGNVGAFQDFSVINASINSLENDVNILSTTINGATSDKIDDISTRLATAITNIGTNSTNITTNANHINTIDVSINNINSSIGTVKGNITTINTSIGLINTSIGGINSSLGNINSSIGLIKSNITTLTDDLLAHKTDCDASLAEFSETWAAALIDIRYDIQDLNDQLTALQFQRDHSFTWSEAIGSVTYEENPEFARVYLDAEDKILYAVDVDGHTAQAPDLRRMETDSEEFTGSYLTKLISYLESEGRDGNGYPQTELIQGEPSTQSEEGGESGETEPETV